MNASGGGGMHGGAGGAAQANTPEQLKKAGGGQNKGGPGGRLSSYDGNGGTGSGEGGQSRKFFIQRLYDSFFAVMVELLKNKKISMIRCLTLSK